MVLSAFEPTAMAMELDLPMDTATDTHAFAPVSQPRLIPPSQSDQQPQQQTARSAAANNIASTQTGPLPTGFGLSIPNSTGSTLTEFTKRRNWSQRVVEELRDLLQILTPDGRLMYLSPSCRVLTGYEPQHLQSKFIVDYIHPDDSGIFVREFNESIATGNPLRFFFRFRKEDSSYAIFEAHGHPHLSSEPVAFGQNNLAPLCRGFFMMCRPYPTKNANFLDSFLEHKIENERLMKKIADLKREEAEENDAQDRQWTQKGESYDSTTVSDAQRTDARTTESVGSGGYGRMPPPPKPNPSNTALTSQNLHEALAGYKPDSINDKMARYEGASHIETIEMLTGLHYRDGERSYGISTGDTSPALIRGDAGIAILVDREKREGEKKKKVKITDEYVCTDCGTLDSPEWRKGPNGPKTLCNACGRKFPQSTSFIHNSD